MNEVTLLVTLWVKMLTCYGTLRKRLPTELLSVISTTIVKLVRLFRVSLYAHVLVQDIFSEPSATKTFASVVLTCLSCVSTLVKLR